MTDYTSAEHDEQSINLQTYNNVLKQSKCMAKKNYYEQIFNKVKNDIKGTWKTKNGILNKTKRKKTFPKMFKENGTIYTNKTDIANKFDIIHKFSPKNICGIDRISTKLIKQSKHIFICHI